MRSFNVAHRAAGPGTASTATTPAPPVREAGRALRGNGTLGPLLLALTVLAAYATPEIAIRDAWPAVRIEQVAALGAGLWLLRRWFQTGRTLHPSPVDLAFAGLALVTLASSLYAPLVLGDGASARDLFEVVKLLLFWVLFRFGWEVARTDTVQAARFVLSAVLAGGVTAAVIALAQYYDVLGFNAGLTALWTPAHHLHTLVEEARAVGVSGNPNYFGLTATIALFSSVAGLVCGARGGERMLCLAALAAGAVAIVTSGSRGALLAFGMGLLVLVVTRICVSRNRRRVLRPLALASGAVLLTMVAAVGIVETAPRGRETYLTRLTRSIGTEGDGSLALRLERWRSALPWNGDVTAAGTAPDRSLTYLENGSLEDGTSAPRGFRTLPGTRVEMSEGHAHGGRRSVRFLGNPTDPERRAAIFQQRYLGRADGRPLTAALWVVFPAPASGELALWVNVIYADGSRSDPHARVPVDLSRTGEWQQIVAPVTPDAGRTATFIGVYLMGEAFRGEAYVDDFELVDGDAALPLSALDEAGPVAAGTDVARALRRSPLLGGGPAKATDSGALDNEYLTIAARYGLIGLVFYLGLWAATARAAWNGLRRRHDGAPAAVCLTVIAAIAGFAVFNLVAGSLLHLQSMGIFWPLAGVAAGIAATHLPHQRGQPSD